MPALGLYDIAQLKPEGFMTPVHMKRRMYWAAGACGVAIVSVVSFFGTHGRDRSQPLRTNSSGPTTVPMAIQDRQPSPSILPAPEAIPVMLAARFQSGVEISHPDLQHWLQDWVLRQIAGEESQFDDFRQLSQMVSTESIPARDYAIAANALTYLDEKQCVELLLSPLLESVQPVLSDSSPSPRDRADMIEALWSIHANLCAHGRWQSDERVLRALVQCQTPGSGRSQSARYAYAEALYMQQKYYEALRAFEDVLREREIAFEAAESINRPLDWELALSHYYLGNYAAAAGHFTQATKVKGVPEEAHAWPMAVVSYARSGDTLRAQQTVDDWIRQRKPTTRDVAPILSQLEGHDFGAMRSEERSGRYVLRLEVAQSEGLAAAMTKLESLRSNLQRDPRSAATGIYKDRALSDCLLPGAWREVSELALACINAQPDRVDRLTYFMTIRIEALLGAGKSDEALLAAKSLYNVCSVQDVRKAIDLVAKCITAARPRQPGLSNRFILQQIAGCVSDGTNHLFGVDLGTPVFSSIPVSGTEYDGGGLRSERNREWRSFGQANVLLMQDEPKEARRLFESLTHSMTSTVAEAANEGLARVLKAETARLNEANDYLRSRVQPNKK
jgi:tetratricopeptide (TPR) repeat protein